MSHDERDSTRPGPNRRHVIAALPLAAVAAAAPAHAAQGRGFGEADVQALAGALARRPYSPPSRDLPAALSKLDYDAYRDIRFDPAKALSLAERPDLYPGIGVEAVAVRSYPAPSGANAAHLLGYLGRVTEVDFKAEFRVNLPLIGRSLEAAAAPYVRRVIDTQQAVGNDYLAGRLA